MVPLPFVPSTRTRSPRAQASRRVAHAHHGEDDVAVIAALLGCGRHQQARPHIPQNLILSPGTLIQNRNAKPRMDRYLTGDKASLGHLGFGALGHRCKIFGAPSAEAITEIGSRRIGCRSKQSSEELDRRLNGRLADHHKRDLRRGLDAGLDQFGIYRSDRQTLTNGPSAVDLSR
jgi:hypothetical protein